MKFTSKFNLSHLKLWLEITAVVAITVLATIIKLR